MEVFGSAGKDVAGFSVYFRTQTQSFSLGKTVGSAKNLDAVWAGTAKTQVAGTHCLQMSRYISLMILGQAFHKPLS